MAQVLSSRLTPVYKFVLPTVVMGGMAFAAWTAYFHPETMNGPDGWSRDYAWVMMIVAAVLMGGILLWVGAPLVRVELGDGELILSNYRFEMHVPLTQIASISAGSFTSPRRYTITFAEETELGRTVTLLPPLDMANLGLGEARALAALRAAWDEARLGRGKGAG